MQNNAVVRIKAAAIPRMLLCCLLFAAVPAIAQSAPDQAGSRVCSNRSLSGDYGFSAQGQVLPGPGLAFPFTSTGKATFDGNGDVSWLEHTIVGGAQQGADWTAASGTYTVNPDCTGMMVVITPNSPVPLNIFFSLVQHGKQFYSVVNGNAISAVWTKLD